MPKEDLDRLVAIIALSALVGLYTAHAYETEHERQEDLEQQRQGVAPTTNPPQTYQEAEAKLIDMLGPHQADYVKNQSTNFISCSNDQTTREILCYER